MESNTSPSEGAAIALIEFSMLVTELIGSTAFVLKIKLTC